MNDPAREPEAIWADLLSGEPNQARRAYRRLSPEEQRQVVDHLDRMATEAGWHGAQRERARQALAAIREGAPTENP